jgi:hypothetical protein
MDKLLKRRDEFMEKNTLVIRGSFRGIAAELIKRLIIFICTIIIYQISNSIKNKFFTEYNINSFTGFVMEFDHAKVIIIISSIYLLFVILLFIALATIYKIINILYETLSVVTFDFPGGKVTEVTYSFPFIKKVDENKFDEVINVNISQGLMNQLFSSGNMYVEYLTCSKVDSQLRNLEISNVVHPFKTKLKMM